MLVSEKKRKLSQLPWQAVFELAVEKGIDEEGLKSKTRSEIIDSIFLEQDVSDEKISKLLENYIYGDRVTFTLWYFNKEVTNEQVDRLLRLETCSKAFIDISGFRNFRVLSVQKVNDRYEIVYTYSKEYIYLSEEGKDSSIWEMHRGCVWVGADKPYLACISKHENMTRFITSFVASSMGNKVTQIKPPKSAVEKCTKIQAKSRVTIQDYSGAKTTFSCSTGLTEDQRDEEERLRTKRDTFDTAGNYIAEITEGIVGTIKHNIHKGSIGIYKHLPADVLFKWSDEAITTILNEIDKLKGQPVVEIYESMGLHLKWTLSMEQQTIANWILTNIISLEDDGQIQIPMLTNAECLLDDEVYFMKAPRIYCNECEEYEPPVCCNCGKPLKMSGKELVCDCGASVEIVCAEGHRNCKLTAWYIATRKFKSEIKRNLNIGFPGMENDIAIFVLDETLVIKRGLVPDDEVEIQFYDIKEFQKVSEQYALNRRLVEYAVKMKEKCEGGCSNKKIEKCLMDKKMVCLPKLFMGYLPNFRVQPHKGSEFGDVHGQVTVGRNHYLMKGIIKKNSFNTGKRTLEEMLTMPLLETSSEGEEIIRQFVTQGMEDNRAQLIAIVAPQHFDQNVQATIDYLARLSGKKVVFIGIEQICQLLNESEYIEHP